MKEEPRLRGQLHLPSTSQYLCRKHNDKEGKKANHMIENIKNRGLINTQ